jgi:hypothetical protein
MKGSRFTEEQIIGVLREHGSWSMDRRGVSAIRRNWTLAHCTKVHCTKVHKTMVR